MLVSENSITPLTLEGAFLIKPKEFQDERGTLLKIYTSELLNSVGINFQVVEDYATYSKKGVVRGLHFQKEPCSQAKLVSCYAGDIFDVIVDLRQGSPTFGKWASNLLTGSNRHAVYVPRGFAHGCLSLSEGSLLAYKADNAYSPQHESGVRWDDKALGIKWPHMGSYIVSAKDSALPSLNDCL